MTTTDHLRAILEPTEPPNFPAYRAERERRVLAKALLAVQNRCNTQASNCVNIIAINSINQERDAIYELITDTLKELP